MCKVLRISRSLIYYKRRPKKDEKQLENLIQEIFKSSRNNYGSRKIKKELEKNGHTVSRKKIRRIMETNGLVSNYTIKQYKVHKSACNNDSKGNLLDRKFYRSRKMDVVVSDLTYVNVGGRWNYICLILDLYNREIIGYSAGDKKNGNLVIKAFGKIDGPLDSINIFHTDRGNEFKNKIIDELLEAFNIERSLSKKGCPYDNAVAEATYKIIKTEFVFNKIFKSLDELELELFDYVNWYNNVRIHGALGYLTPSEYKLNIG